MSFRSGRWGGLSSSSPAPPSTPSPSPSPSPSTFPSSSPVPTTSQPSSDARSAFVGPNPSSSSSLKPSPSSQEALPSDAATSRVSTLVQIAVPIGAAASFIPNRIQCTTHSCIDALTLQMSASPLTSPSSLSMMLFQDAFTCFLTVASIQSYHDATCLYLIT